MLHPATELRFVDRTIGYGVFATALIPAGTLTWVLDPLDQVIEPERLRALDARAAAHLEKYSWLIPTGQRILCWDFCRYMNHSCAPNCLTASVDLEIAVRDIHPGEQLTNDYATLNLERPFTCRCGEPGCRRRVHPEDGVRLAPVYDRQLADAMRHVSACPQPLLPWIQGHRRRRGPLSSILTRRLRTPARPAMAQKSVR